MCSADKYFAEPLEKADGQKREETAMRQPNEQIRLARMEAIADSQRAEQPDVQEAALQAAIALGDGETAAAIARTIRNRLLKDCDAEVALDRLGLSAPDGSTFTAWIGFLRQLGAALTGEWAVYRQALRDLPASEGWPGNIAWPTKPGEEESGET